MSQPQSRHFSAYGQDIFNYLAVDNASNHQLHMVLSFDGYLSQESLNKAIRISMDLEPVLGCNFVEHPETPYFNLRTDLDALDHCPVYEAADPDKALKEFICLSTNPQKDPFVQARIIRTNNKDLLCVKLDHTVCDGGGLKEYIYLLADLYTQLCSHQSPATKEPSRRDCAYILKKLGIADPRNTWQPSGAPTVPAWSFPHSQHRNEQPTFTTRQLTQEQFLQLKAAAKNNAATINDALLTAYYRALFTITDTPEEKAMPISVSTDLRRYVPEKIIAANVGSSFNTFLTCHKKECFLDTLKHVHKITANLKQSQAFIPTALFFEFMGWQDFQDTQKFYNSLSQQNRKINSMPPFLSNVGVIKPLRFAQLAAKEAYIVTPAMLAPLFMLGASTYNNLLTLIVSYYASDIDQKLVNRFLDLMLVDLTCPV